MARRRRNPGSVDHPASNELELFIVNDGDLYRQSVQPIVKNLAKKVAKGQYDKDLAIKAWGYAADWGAQKYTKEYGGSGNGTYGSFNKPTRMDVAKSLEDYYRDEVNEAAAKLSPSKTNPHRFRRNPMAKSTRRGHRVTFKKGGKHTVVFRHKVATAATKAKRRAAGKRLAKMWTKAERMANLRKAWAANRRRGRKSRRR